ncbi:MAG: hypothetical protein GY787_10355 [Alteromonadales bacterium]|nr:hypothetical protein [Alteromonadales bacterium]MCP4986870.1 hypothetical protein [Colwellia sp.]
MDNINIEYSVNILEVLRSKYSDSLLYKKISSGYEYSANSIAYNIAYHESNYQDNSICLFLNNQPVLFLPLYLHQHKLSYFGCATQVFEVDLSYQQRLTVYKKLNEHLKKVIKTQKINELLITHNEFILNDFFYQCDEINTQVKMFIPLNVERYLLKQSLRKSYKSLVNWGKKNLTQISIDKNNYSEIYALQFREFHKQVAGKQTRSNTTWQIQFEMIKAGEAFLHLYYLSNKLVAGNLTLLGNNTAFYAVGVYDRQVMQSKKLPLSHWPLLNAIYTCQELGINRFELGGFDSDINDGKLQQISDFKKGFSTNMEIINNLTLSFPHG